MSANYISWEDAVHWLRSRPEQKKLVYHCYYDDPIEKAADRFYNSEEWHAVFQILRSHLPGKVLDIGAGRGISTYAFARLGCSVTSLEPDPSPLVGSQAIRQLFSVTGLPVTIVEEAGEQLPFAEASFDIVYGRAVFHHARDLKRFCSEAHRVLKPGGIFLMSREHVISQKKDLNSFLNAHPLHSLYGGENAFLLDEYTDAICSSGLNILKTIGPYESVINYAPMTDKEFSQMVASAFVKFLGKKPCAWLAGQHFFVKWQGRRLSLKCDHPGRLYTFWARK